MLVWIAFAVLCVVALLLLLRPFLWPAAGISDGRSSDLAVYRDQLSEVEAELARGVISPSEADAARNEIKRKMLAVAPSPGLAQDPQRAARLLRLAIGIGVPVLGVGLYLAVGQPSLPGKEFAGPSLLLPESQPQAGQLPDVETLAARLAERLKKTPDDAQGWRMLGWSYASLDRNADAAKAFERSVALDGKNAAVLAQYGESLVRVANGVLTAEAEKIFERSLAIDPKEPRSLFFRGLALEQRGKSKQALAVWVKILRDENVQADWIPALHQRATELAIKLKLDPAREVPALKSPDLEAAAIPAVAPPGEAPAHEDPSALVDRLSQRLESSPKDFEGWMLLARTYRSLGRNEMARASLARAKEIFAGAPFVLQKIATAEAELARPLAEQAAAPPPRGPTPSDVAAASQLSAAEQNAMIIGMVAGLEERLRRNSNDLEGWLMLARSRKVMGDSNAARAAIGRAEELFGSNPQARARIAEVVTQLGLN